MEIECLINKDLLLKGTCICCLDNIGPYINLATCSHKEFLDAFPIPHFSPYQPDIVCNRCHAILKKVAQFKLQVQESFNILLNKTESLKEDKEIKRNLHISKIVHLNIPEPREDVIDKLKLKLQNTKRPNNIELIEDSNTENSRTKSQNLTRLNNVETALKIINTNTNSLQSLTAYNNFVDLTRSLVEATVKSLYSSPMSTSVLPDLKITKDTTSQNYITGSPLKRKTDSQNGIGDESILSTSDNDNTKLERISNIEIDLKEEIKEEMDVEFINKELPRKSNIYTDNNSGVLYNKNLKNFKKIKEDTEIEIIDEPILNASVKKEIHVKGEIKEKSNIDIDKVNKSNAMFVENDNECKDSPKITMLPIENKMQCDDVVILSHYGTAVLPDAVKCDPDNATDSSIVLENCLGKNMENENGQTNQAEINQNSVNVKISSSEDEDSNLQMEEKGKKIIFSLLPAKSQGIYVRTYEKFMKWRAEKRMDTLKEGVFLTYFDELSKKYQSSTLWSRYSMLRTTIQTKHNVNIKKYLNLTAFLKKMSRGYKAKKSKIFTREDIENFVNKAPNEKYLATKVALIFGISGACRATEMANITVNDITTDIHVQIVTLPNTKTNKERKFVITGEFLKVVKAYQDLRPNGVGTPRYFLNYQNGKCTKQVIGKNKFNNMPKEIATYLKLPNPELYTGHCFRRTYKTIVEYSGGYIPSLERGDIPISDEEDENIENLVQNELDTTQGIAEPVSILPNNPQPSTSRQDSNQLIICSEHSNDSQSNMDLDESHTFET